MRNKKIIELKIKQLTQMIVSNIGCSLNSPEGLWIEALEWVLEMPKKKKAKNG